MRTLAIDYGLRRVGLALSDEGGRFAAPLDVLEIASPADALNRVETIARREGAARLVLGLPLNMDDTLSAMARQVLAWGRDLARRTGLPVFFVDERLSSFEAEQQLISRKKAGERLTRQGKKERRDALAAAQFLQSFLDGQLQPIDPAKL